MNKKNVLIIVAIIALLLSLFGFVYKKNGSDS